MQAFFEIFLYSITLQQIIMNTDSITNITLDFNYNSEADKTKIINVIREQFYESMLPIIENVLERFSTTEIFRIECINIDLGQITIDKLPALFEKQMELLLRQLFIDNEQNQVEANGKNGISIVNKKDGDLTTLI